MARGAWPLEHEIMLLEIIESEVSHTHGGVYHVLSRVSWTRIEEELFSRTTIRYPHDRTKMKLLSYFHGTQV